MFHPSDHEAPLGEEEFRLLRDFVHERFGLWFADTQRASLRTRLLGRLAGLDLRTFEDYYHYLRFGPQRQDEQERMIGHLTNNETYFFREQAQLTVLAEPLLRELRERKTRTGAPRELRLLSAGCSSGEEALTLAMVVFDSGQFFWNWSVRVLGFDVDSAALERARRGVYHPYSFRGTTPAQRERHFQREGPGFRPKEVVRRMVEFHQANLLDRAALQALGRFDAIFCRNVLIYFSDASSGRALANLHELLLPGGSLFLGHAESLARVDTPLRARRFPGALLYERPLECA
jgi:chemotaxis protein methyltransferase CheR